MAAADPETLWAVLLAEGHAALGEPEQIEVTLWLLGHFPGAMPATFLIESAAEAGRVAAFAHHWIDVGKAQLAAPLARLALAAHEQACGVDAAPTAGSVAALALALTEIDWREGVPELRREAAGLVDRYRTMMRTLAGDADPRIAWSDVIASRLAAADGRSAEAADLMARAYDRVVVACGPLHDFVRAIVDRFIDLDPLRASASMRAELARRDGLADADDAATLQQIRDVLVTTAHWYEPDEASRHGAGPLRSRSARRRHRRRRLAGRCVNSRWCGGAGTMRLKRRRCCAGPWCCCVATKAAMRPRWWRRPSISPGRSRARDAGSRRRRNSPRPSGSPIGCSARTHRRRKRPASASPGSGATSPITTRTASCSVSVTACPFPRATIAGRSRCACCSTWRSMRARTRTNRCCASRAPSCWRAAVRCPAPSSWRAAGRTSCVMNGRRRPSTPMRPPPKARLMAPPRR